MSAPATAEDRSQFIGGSEVGAILGVDPFTTRLQVYERKVGLSTETPSNFHMKRGTRLEEVAAEEYAAKHGVTLHRVNKRIVHPDYPFITARIDRRVVGQSKLTEFKVPFLGSFSKIKKTGLHEGYIAQMQTYLGLTKYEAGDWGIFNADLWELLDFSVNPDHKLIADITERLVDFWTNYVTKRVPPPPADADQERLDIQRAEGSAKLFTVTSPELIEALQNLREAKTLAADAEKIDDDAKARIKELVGDDFGVYVAPGLRFSYTQAKGRTSFDKKALAGARPLDRLRVGAALTPLFQSSPVAVTRELIENAIREVGKCEINLSQFEKTGDPYAIMKVTAGGK